MTLLWQCYDNVLTMLWQCYDNVPRTVILFPFTPTVLLMIYWIIHKIYDVPSIMWGKAGKKLQRSWQRRVVFTSCPYLIFATRTPAAVLVQKKLSAWAWFSSKTSPQAKRHRPSLLFTAEIYFSSQIKTMLKYNSVMNNHVQGLNFKQACWGSNVLTFCLDNRSSLAFYFSGYQVECVGQFGLRIVMVYFLKPPSILVLLSLKYAGRWLMDILLYKTRVFAAYGLLTHLHMEPELNKVLESEWRLKCIWPRSSGDPWPSVYIQM